MKEYLRTKFDKKKLVDAGLALILLCLLIYFYAGIKASLYIAFIAAVIVMLSYAIIYPWAFIWYNMTDLLGNIVSKALLILIYLLIVWPIGFIRQILGKDSMQLRKFCKSTESVFNIREKTYEAKDLEKPY
jgi:hypothetical protein